MKEKSEKPRYRVPALDRALDILEYLARVSVPMPLSSIAKDLNKTPSEVFRVIDRLVKRNYIIKDKTLNAYSLSLKFFELTNSIPPIKRLIDASFMPLSKLVKETGFSCHLSVLEGGDLVVIYAQAALAAVQIQVKMGGRIPAVNTSSGRFLLSTFDQDILRGILSLDEHFSSLEPKDQRKIERDIASLGKIRHGISKSKQQPGVYDVVALIELYRDRYAALAVPVFQLEEDKAQLLRVEKEVLSAVEEIKKNIGAL